MFRMSLRPKKVSAEYQSLIQQYERFGSSKSLIRLDNGFLCMKMDGECMEKLSVMHSFELATLSVFHAVLHINAGRLMLPNFMRMVWMIKVFNFKWGTEIFLQPGRVIFLRQSAKISDRWRSPRFFIIKDICRKCAESVQTLIV